jgi:hypothetical protein
MKSNLAMSAESQRSSESLDQWGPFQDRRIYTVLALYMSEFSKAFERSGIKVHCLQVLAKTFTGTDQPSIMVGLGRPFPSPASKYKLSEGGEHLFRA